MIQFCWHSSDVGHSCLDGPSGEVQVSGASDREWILPVASEDVRCWRRYLPMRHTALFRNFAENRRFP
jgi:hypothetical protein